MTIDDDLRLPPRLEFLNRPTIAHLATAIDDCVAALNAGERVRGMDPFAVLAHVAELLHAAAQEH